MADVLSWYRSYVRVVETGSFSAVAAELQSTQPSISRQVAALERHLGTLLLQRSTRALSLTEDGRAFYAQALRVLAAVDDAEGVVGKGRSAPRGVLRLACPVVFGRMHLAPLMPALLRHYPELAMDLVMSEAKIDLVEEGIDLAIRIGDVADEQLIARPIGTTQRITLAAPAYLARRGRPQHPQELGAHECVLFSSLSTPEIWQFDSPEGAIAVRVQGRLRSNNSEAVRAAVAGGLGIGVLPTWHFSESLEAAGLERILEGFEPAPMTINAVYSSRRYLAPKVRAVIDFLVAEFAAHPTLAPMRSGADVHAPKP
ncbi:MAG: LysR family transcriptional regulator [Xanthomonadales bacterium]|nr:LysR family transcriptional regulator [Xanthomonadales bacterium]